MRVILPPLALLLLVTACGSGDGALPSATPATPAPTARTTPTPSLEVSLVAGGDVMLGRTIGEGIVANEAAWPFVGVAETLRDADIGFVNLEAPLTERGSPARKDFVFRGPSAGATGLANSGVDIVSLANNHAMDYGAEGLADTITVLDYASVQHVGAGANEILARAAVPLERNGLRVAFLAYVNTPPDSVSGFDVSQTQATATSAGVAWLSPEAVAADVTKAKAVADVIVVSMHTGYEYTEAPSELQVASAHAAIDAGAALVLGGHPHVLQGIERYKGGLIIYSLGNFVFDFDSVDYSHPGLPSALSAMLRVNLTKAGVASCELVPVVTAEADGRPHLASAAEAAPVLERMRRLSDGSCGLG